VLISTESILINNNNAVASEQKSRGDKNNRSAGDALRELTLAKAGQGAVRWGKRSNSRTPAEAQNKAATGGENAKICGFWGSIVFGLVGLLQADVGRL
jgi:hypothetical protein